MKFNKHGIAKTFKFESLSARNGSTTFISTVNNEHLQITMNKQWSKPATILQ